MPTFKSTQDPIKVLTNLRNDFSKKISEALESSNLQFRIEKAKTVISEYHDIMSSLSSMKKYKDNPNSPEIMGLKLELRRQLEQVTSILEKSTIGLQMNEKAIREKNRELILGKIDSILIELRDRANQITKNLPKSFETASNLLRTLTNARDEYELKLQTGSNSSFNEAGELFKSQCQKAIDAALPLLEKDLGWGDYLRKILENIANAIIYVVTATTVNGFFTHSKLKFENLNETKRLLSKEKEDLTDIDTKEKSDILEPIKK